MNAHEIRYVAWKELLLLSRDMHGLLLLFVMPLVFIVVMSLALRDLYATNQGRPTQIEMLVYEDGPAVDELLTALEQHVAYRIRRPMEPDRAAALQNLNRGDTDALLEVLPGLDDFAEIAGPEDAAPVLRLTLPAKATRQQELALRGVLLESLSRVRLSRMVEGLSELDPRFADMSTTQLMGLDALATDYLYGREVGAMPSAVQQNVPAWLIFALFFIVVPLSNTFIREKLQGTLHRLRTLPIQPSSLMLGKCIPYFFVSQVQVILMLLVGIYLVPLLGGDRLTLGPAWHGLIIMSMAVSWCALGYALLIAVIVRTPEQAVTLGGMGNILLAAVGGIMVPSFVMPEFMQILSNLSPMAWALQGFLDVLLRHGGWSLLWKPVLLLTAFGTACICAAISLYYRAR